MSLYEFGHVMAGLALRNGAKRPEADAPGDDEFYEALQRSIREGRS